MAALHWMGLPTVSCEPQAGGGWPASVGAHGGLAGGGSWRRHCVGSGGGGGGGWRRGPCMARSAPWRRPTETRGGGAELPPRLTAIAQRVRASLLADPLASKRSAGVSVTTAKARWHGKSPAQSPHAGRDLHWPRCSGAFGSALRVCTPDHFRSGPRLQWHPYSFSSPANSLDRPPAPLLDCRRCGGCLAWLDQIAYALVAHSLPPPLTAARRHLPVVRRHSSSRQTIKSRRVDGVSLGSCSSTASSRSSPP